MAKRDLTNKPADPQNPRGATMALRMRGIDAEPFTETLAGLSYPCHLEFKDGEVTVYATGQKVGKDTGTVLRPYADVEAVDRRIGDCKAEIVRLEELKVQIDAEAKAAKEAAEAEEKAEAEAKVEAEKATKAEAKTTDESKDKSEK